MLDYKDRSNPIEVIPGKGHVHRLHISIYDLIEGRNRLITSILQTLKPFTMSFQIHSPEGEAIPLNELDKEAALFWGTEYDHTSAVYATPNGVTSWFGTIGWAINNPVKYTSGWDDVKCTLWVIQSKRVFKELQSTDLIDQNYTLLNELQSIKRYLKPYYELIDHWESKGYKPVKLP